MTTIGLRVTGTGEILEVGIRRLLIAGFTGRDQRAVQDHVAELAELGVPVPSKVPILMPCDPSLVTTSERIAVTGTFTSGEVEAVLVVHGGRRWLAIGSDHTDRDLERRDIAVSKAACPKILGPEVLPLDAVDDLDAVTLESVVDDEDVPYQRGLLADLLPLPAIEQLLAEEGLVLAEGDVCFLGSLAVVGGKLRPARRFTARIGVPALGRELRLDYAIDLVATPPTTKPELEFTPVEEVAWTPAEPRVPGLTERILARYGDSAIATRMLRFAPGTDTSVAGTLRHDFWEEVYILSGALHDLVLEETFPAGTYACRPPGMPHGPWVAPEGCVTFEVRYPAPPGS